MAPKKRSTAKPKKLNGPERCPATGHHPPELGQDPSAKSETHRCAREKGHTGDHASVGGKTWPQAVEKSE